MRAFGMTADWWAPGLARWADRRLPRAAGDMTDVMVPRRDRATIGTWPMTIDRPFPPSTRAMVPAPGLPEDRAAAVALAAAGPVPARAAERAGDAETAAQAAWRWDKGVCRFCGTGCGIQVAVHDGRVVSVKGDRLAGQPRPVA